MIRNIIISCVLMTLVSVAAQADFGIISPLERKYISTSIPFNVAGDEIYGSINYSIDGGVAQAACWNCSSYSKVLNFTEGNHTLEVTAGNTSKTVDFRIEIDREDPQFSLGIVKPAYMYYREGPMVFEVRSNTVLDWIALEVDNATYACENCSALERTFNLSEGAYIAIAKGSLENTTLETRTEFIVQPTQEQSGVRIDRTPFREGFEKLPKTLEQGAISDSDLADILRESNVPPGVINRLIMTGLLGNDSIDAILEYQFNPPGILRKLLAMIGVKEISYPELIHQHYTLSSHQEERLILRDDFPQDKAERIKSKLKENVKKQVEISEKKRDRSAEDGQKASHERESVKEEISPASGMEDDAKVQKAHSGAVASGKKDVKVIRQDPGGRSDAVRSRDARNAQGNPGNARKS